MKYFKIEKVAQQVIEKVICDICGKNCTNTYSEIKVRHSFTSEDKPIEVVCYNCYEQNYNKKYQENKEKMFKELFKGVVK